MSVNLVFIAVVGFDICFDLILDFFINCEKFCDASFAAQDLIRAMPSGGNNL